MMHATLTSAGAIVFDAGPTLSRQQVLLLVTLAAQPSGRASARGALRRALWPAQLGPLTPAQRSSLARALYRMQQWGLLTRSTPATVQITPAGLRLYRWIEGWGSWAAYRDQWLATLQTLTDQGEQG